MAILPIPCYNSGVLSFFKIITRRSDIFCIFYLQVYMYLFVHMISTFVYLCDCGKFPLPSPSVAFVRKHLCICICICIYICICICKHLCICVIAANFLPPSPSVAFVRKHGDWQSAFSMIYTFAQVESSVWISFNKLLNSRLAKSILIPDAILMRPKKIDSGKIVQQANQLRDFMLD